jgi:hypothetical protein
VTVKADLEGTYGIAESESTFQCISNGVVESEILTAAGAAPVTS